jgi:5-(hydroxymethyl)furfural/furfural oxidase
MTDYDYLIVGGGAAGCVLANRLSASGRSRVLMLEAGADLIPGREPADIRSVFPLSSFNDRYMWPDTYVHWRRNSPAVPHPQGKIMGGSSQIMGMFAARGHPQDFDEWAAGGATGWDWEGVLPYFRRLETDVDFGGPLHGSDGPLPIRRERKDAWGPVARTIHEATLQRGWADIADMNADFADGHCALPMSREENARASAGLNYLTASVRARTNLDVRGDCAVERLLIEDGAVVGVEATGKDRRRETVRARTTIVTAGALRSPVLLMRSGIGPATELKDAGIAVVRDLPGVGQNLRNHAIIYIVGMLTRAGLDPSSGRGASATYLRWSSGVADMPAADMAMYVRSYLTWHALGRRMASLAPCLMRPVSRGRISLDPADPWAKPGIEFDLLSDLRDRRRMEDGVRLAVALFREMEARGISGPPMVLTQAATLARYNRLSRLNAIRAGAAALMLDIAPSLGRAVVNHQAKMIPAATLIGDDAALTAFVENAVSGTGHVCGTCRMGREEDRQAVVNPMGAVHGVPGLMVADASVMPNVPSGNTHLPTVMAAEKIAAGLTGDHASRV